MYNKFTSKIISLFLPFESIIENLTGLVSDLEAENDSYQKFYEYTNSLENTVEKSFDCNRVLSTEEMINLLQPVREHLLSYSDKLEKYQDIKRYTVNSDDTFKIKVLKRIKKIGLKTFWFKINASNLYRRIRKKTPLEYTTKKQVVYPKQLAEYVYVNLFFSKFLIKLESVLLEREKLFLEIKNFDHKITIDILSGDIVNTEEFKTTVLDLKERYNLLKFDLEQYFSEMYALLTTEYEKLEQLTNTVEFPVSNISKLRTEQQYGKLELSLNKLFEVYKIRLFSISEHWNLIRKVRLVCFKSVESFSFTVKHVMKHLDENYQVNDKKANELLKQTTEAFKTENQGLELVEENLNQALVKGIVPNYLDKIMKADVKTELNSLSELLVSGLSSINQVYRLPLKTKFENLKSEKQLKKLELDEIIEGWAHELIKIPLEKEIVLFNDFQTRSIAYLNELSGIVEYANEYFLSSSGEEKEKHIDEFMQGIQRAQQKAEERCSNSILFASRLKDNLNLINKKLIQEITLTISPEQLKIRHIQMLKKRLILDFKRKLNSYFDVIKIFGRKNYLKAVNILKELRSKYSSYKEVLGLSASQASINSELSNYLSETEVAIGKLPLMYQKLFSIAPVNNAKFRVVRPKVGEKLEKAYSNWTSAKFAPTCIVGETGSGLTSLINEFVEKFGHQYPVVRINPKSRIKTEKEFIDLFSELSETDELNTFIDLRDVLLTSKSRRIIILENIHRLYIRKMGGFDLLNSLFQLISQTNSKVYWVTTCLFYSFSYFEYSIGISNYYAHVAILDKLSKDQIKETILNRHKYSGYNLNFIAPENYLGKRSFKKLSLNEKQQVLQEDYFKRLFNYAQNNLSLALMFWMRSVVNVEDNTFNMQFKNLNLLFVNSLNSSQIATLYAMVLHGGMSVKDHCEVFELSEQESVRQLMVFVDDGILVNKNEEYSINPLVYRQVVNHLTSLNYIH